MQMRMEPNVHIVTADVASPVPRVRQRAVSVDFTTPASCGTPPAKQERW